MLSLIILGLTAVFVQTQKAFKSGIKQATVTDAGRTITDMIASDLRQMVDSGNTNVINFYCDWSLTNEVLQTNPLAGAANEYLRTNQMDEIYILERTNNVWMGVGYAVSNVSTGVGSLYRYVAFTNGPEPLATNNLFLFFSNSIVNQLFSGTNWHRLADGVVHLKVRSFDLNGNECYPEYYMEQIQGGAGYPYYSYPGPFPTEPPFMNTGVTNTLPAAVELELGILEPETLGEIASLPAPAQGRWITNQAVSKEEIFRERIIIPAVVR